MKNVHGENKKVAGFAINVGVTYKLTLDGTGNACQFGSNMRLGIEKCNLSEYTSIANRPAHVIRLTFHSSECLRNPRKWMGSDIRCTLWNRSSHPNLVEQSWFH
jgi:hypothetical protein